ncbi:MAG: polysaccharide deacetylase family protein [Gammaproteobacteria bacterium]|nr:polysaccharide deacetylase family protein [Gammaproteobacteria bacterium]MBU1775616.1 polysaccharide deacetylase family protein [Gammaproteobacteria bacterium]MBU1969737.1 polysaccharide deacetylase family protein [Gammaproteobacteria bacterium]
MSTKRILRNNIGRLLYLAGLTAPGRRGRDRLSIATFHRVLPEVERQSYPFPGLVVTPAELDAFLTYFTKHFDCGTLATQHERYLNGEKTSRPLLAITFDDAQHDNLKYARPILARHNIKASFFAPVSAITRQELLWHDRLGFAILNLLKQTDGGQERLMQILATAGISASGPNNLASTVVAASKKLKLDARLHLVKELETASGSAPAPEFARLMTFDEIAELAADGHEIGSHSMSHCLMPECDDRALAYEVAESRRLLQERLGIPIDTFCYPNGNSDARTAQAVAQAGYRRAVTTTWGNNGPDADRFQLSRYDMVAKHVQGSRGEFVPAQLAFRMSGYYPGLG